MATEARWTVVIADVAASRQFPPARRRALDAALKRAAARTLRRWPQAFRLAPELQRGDELEAVLRADAPVLELVLHLRAQLRAALPERVELRVGIGTGPIALLSRKGPFASEGVAFHRARNALESMAARSGTARTAWESGDPAFDAPAASVLTLLDVIAARWTRPQWEAIAGRLEGDGLHEIARHTKVSFQSVSKRLRAASWNEVAEALARFPGADAAARSPGGRPNA